MFKFEIKSHRLITEATYAFSLAHQLFNVGSIRGSGLPFIPTLVAELNLGFDLMMNTEGYSLFLQFKMADEIKLGSVNRHLVSENKEKLAGDAFRIDLDVRQNQQLVANSGLLENVYYAAPFFTTHDDLRKHFFDGTLISGSVFVPPILIPGEELVEPADFSSILRMHDFAGKPDPLSPVGGKRLDAEAVASRGRKTHCIAYDAARAYMFSTPIEVPGYSKGKNVFLSLKNRGYIHPADYLARLYNQYIVKDEYAYLFLNLRAWVQNTPDFLFHVRAGIVESAIQFVILRSFFRLQFNLEFFLFSRQSVENLLL